MLRPVWDFILRSRSITAAILIALTASLSQALAVEPNNEAFEFDCGSLNTLIDLPFGFNFFVPDDFRQEESASIALFTYYGNPDTMRSDFDFVIAQLSVAETTREAFEEWVHIGLAGTAENPLSVFRVSEKIPYGGFHHGIAITDFRHALLSITNRAADVDSLLSYFDPQLMWLSVDLDTE